MARKKVVIPVVRDNLEFEKDEIKKGRKIIAGVDEVGRGPLAGPVVVAAVIMPLGEGEIIEGVTDSKKLTPARRKVLAEKIRERAIDVKIVSASHEEVDELNIYQATKKCMEEAIAELNPRPEVALIDAMKLNADCETVSIVKGDLLSYSIAAASIVAKVFRDELMIKFGEEFPGYGFVRNKGYGTEEHIRALKEKGPCSIHRKTFIKNFSE